MCSRTPSTRTVKELSADGEIWGQPTDVTSYESVVALADAVFDRYGVCHLLFNNAGIGAPGSLMWESTPNDWRWTMEVNVLGVEYGILAFVPRMIASGEPGHIVNTSSGNGAVSVLADNGHYAASKAAVRALTEALAAQLEREDTKLRVVDVPSGWSWTARDRPLHLGPEPSGGPHP